MKIPKSFIFIVGTIWSLLLCVKLWQDFPLQGMMRTQNKLPTIKRLYVEDVTVNQGSSEPEADNRPKHLEQKRGSSHGYEKINVRNVSENLYKLAPNVFDGVPEEFLPQFRNPCWWSDKGHTSSDLKCLPYFFLAGMPKCGTTDVYFKLAKHPQIHSSCGIYRKGQLWWTRRRLGGTSLQKYVDCQSVTIGKQLVKGSDPSIITGDCSSPTFWENKNWRKFFPKEELGPPYLIADVIGTVLPKTKILLTLRDPTERLLSDFHYMHHYKWDYDRGPSIFHKEVVDFLSRFNSCLADKQDNRTCAYDMQNILPVRGPIGLFSVYLRDWLKFLPRDHIKDFRMEDLKENCPLVLSQLFEFLQLRKLDSPALKRACQRPIGNKHKKPYKPMLPETQQLLREFYRPYNEELAQMLNDQKYLWEDTQKT
ncbi:carbohydrate sulfotransferase 15-like [Asterias rubens]|uniref:carbohydrate sulfotransferase 15-like n=1 Tax=Asterias rubens TaxID=7604 RepID=UPI001455C9E0|nr:carbohydrate sulfotransferase 15-like [Asterias rubens]